MVMRALGQIFELLQRVSETYGLNQAALWGPVDEAIIRWAAGTFSFTFPLIDREHTPRSTGLDVPSLIWFELPSPGVDHQNRISILLDYLAAIRTLSSPHVVIISALSAAAPTAGFDSSSGLTPSKIDEWLEAEGRPYSLVTLEDQPVIITAPQEQVPPLTEVLRDPEVFRHAPSAPCSARDEARRRTRLCLARGHLSRGEASAALALLKPPVLERLDRRVEPNPQDWSTFLLALLCQGQLTQARRFAHMLPSLNQAEVMQVCDAISYLEGESGALQPPPPERTTAEAGRPPEMSRAWAAALYPLLCAGKQAEFAASLRPLAPQDAIDRMADRERAAPLAEAGTMEITTVIGCKVNCHHCPQGRIIKQYRRRGESREMSLETFQRCLEKLPLAVRVDFSGMAEPWLNSACTEMVLHAVSSGHRVAIYTTLVGMSEADFDLLAGLELEAFVIHVPDAGNLAKIPVTPEYLHLLRRVVETPLMVRNSSNYKASSHGPMHPAVAPIVEPRLPVDYRLHDRAGNVDHLPAERRSVPGPLVCRWGPLLNRNVLLPDGSVLLCCMDYGMEHTLGNLLACSYEELFTGEEAARLEAGLQDPATPILCRACSEARPAL